MYDFLTVVYFIMFLGIADVKDLHTLIQLYTLCYCVL